MEADGVVDMVFVPAAVESPGHAGEGGEEGAVAGHPLVVLQGRGEEVGGFGQLGEEIVEDVFEHGGIDEVLGIGKAAKADRLGADFFLDRGELAGELEASQGAGDRVVEAEEKKGEVITEEEAALGIGKGGVVGHGLLGRAEAFPETAQEPEGGKVALGEVRSGRDWRGNLQEEPSKHGVPSLYILKIN